MRLFVGVELEDSVRTAAAAVADSLRSGIRKAAPDAGIRWIDAGRLHITLWFMGEVQDARAADVRTALGAVPFPTPAFELGLAGCGAFPPSGEPRIVWLGVDPGQSGLRDLYRDVGARLEPLGFLPERREYTPHLTIGRVKSIGPRAGRTVRQVLASTTARCGSFRVEAVTLFRSRLSPRGPDYEPLLRVPLS